MNSEIKRIDVMIVGGGPAGAATALSATGRGLTCVIVEAAPEGRVKAGETIPPNALPLFRKLGIDKYLEDSGHLHCYGNRFVWGSADFEDKSFFSSHQPHGWHIDRQLLERQLLQHVASNGSSVLTGHRFNGCHRDGDGWNVAIRNSDGTIREAHCRYIVDATGRPSRIARSLGVQRQRIDTLVGITVCINLPDIRCPHFTFIETQADGWWYAAPLTRNRLITTFMTDADLVGPALLNIDGFREAINKTTLVKEILDGATIAGCSTPVLQIASTSLLTARYGDGWLAAGDAAFSYDPLSSYGMISALESGYYAGHAIADTLAGNEDAMAAYDWLLCKAFATYREMYTHQYHLETRWPEEVFWKRRNIPAVK